jgi:hypothetical protein
MQFQFSDFINGLFEGLTVIFIVLNIKAILKDKKVRGFTLIYVVFFFTWSVWNLFYYFSLKQPISALSVFFGTILGVCADFLVFYYFYLEKYNGIENRKFIITGLTITPMLFICFGIPLMYFGGQYSQNIHKWPDVINSVFEACGGIVIVGNCLKILKQKEFKGGNMYGVIFTSSWGAWNLFYYFHLHQYFSWGAGLSIFLANCWWIYLILYYKIKEKKSKIQVVYRIKKI